MEALKWKGQNGLLVECLDVDTARSYEIESEVKAKIDAGWNLLQTMDHMREFCQTEEEFVSFVYSIGFWQGSILSVSYKIL